jgi:hypothetical protein
MGTKRRVIDEVKFDVAVRPQSLASTNITGRYFPMDKTKKACFVCQFGQMVAAGTVLLEVFQAKTFLAGSAVLIASASAQGVALRGGQVMTVALATFLATGTITITPYVNNVAGTALVFTAHATVTTKSLRQFSIAGTDTQDGDELVACINDPTYGVPGVFAVNAAGTVSLYCFDEVTTFAVTSAPDDGTCTKATFQGELIVEVAASAISWASGFGWVAAKVTTAGATVICGVTLARFGRFNPVQQSAIAPASV